MRSRRLVTCALISASIGALGGAAQAATYEVSTRNRFFCCTNPALFVTGAPGKAAGFHTVLATASATGSGTPAIRFGMGHAARFYSMITSFPPPITLISAKGTFSVSNAPGTLQKSGGNTGSLSFCPKAKGPGPGACTDPSQATPSYFNGRIRVTPGPNRFGGTLQILAGSQGLGGMRFSIYRLPGSAGPAQIIQQVQPLSAIGAMTPGRLDQAGMRSSYYRPPAASYPMTVTLWQNGAGPFTTGMVTVQVSKNGFPFIRSVVLSGYDDRTPLGVGNIQLVSGLLLNYTQTPLGPPPLSIPFGWQMRIHVIPEPVAGLGLAAGALGLLALGTRCQRRRNP